ncbi:hypothetical protein K8369_35005 [Streptomyces sp. PSKA30]|nr:DUF6879 family protein [Streptomyces sp. PSKA30]MBZ9644454.1 hypothetical protein [Streptomyces sp. PSKA30]
MILTPQGTCIVEGKVVTDAEALSQVSVPHCETCVEVPEAAVTARGRKRVGMTSSAERNRLFERFQRDAFRLELRDDYFVPGEQGPFQSSTATTSTTPA